MVVVPLLSIHAMSENGDHVLIGRWVEMVDLISLVDDISHHIRGRRVDDCRRDDIGHVSEIFVLGNVQLLVGEELSYGSQVHIPT